MDSQPKDSYGYPTDTDAGQPMDDAGEELVEGPDGNFDVVELEVLAWRRREWTQVGKKEKPSIMHEICKEFAKMEKHCDLQLVEWQQKEEQITTWLKKPIRSRKPQMTIQLKHLHMKIEGRAQATKQIDLYQQALSAFIQEDLTNEQRQAAHDIMEKWNGPEGPTPEVQAWNAKKYGLKYMWNFMEEMWQYCRMRIISLTGWKNEEGIIQACCMDFNNDIGGGHMFNDIHTISASWREYLGNAYENPDIAAGEEVQNIAANQPRAKMGDPVKLVTNDKGDIWISDLNGHNCNSILQMVQGYLTVHYHEYMDIPTICTAHIHRLGRACGKWLAKVPFKKLGQYQTNMISSHHLPPNSTFTVDPSHMHISTVMELLNFWKEHQVSHPNDIFAFQKWLDQAGNLQVPRDGSTLPLQIGQKCNTKSWKSPISADDSTDTDNDNTDTEQEATNDMHIPEISPRGKSSDPRHHHKKTPMPFRHPAHRDTNDEDQHEVMSTEDERAGNETLPVVTCPSTSRQSVIQLKGSQVTAELQDASGYMDDDDFDSMPFADVCTTQSGLSRQHDQGGKLKSAMKNHAGHKQNDMEAQPKLKTSSNPQQSTVKPTKRHQGTNDHSSPPGPSAKAVPNEVQPWKSP
ncbi:hypothetical protein EDD17DRAFT_1764433 [Pisolithus thermaeus]|nr:hypothetical protein EV401DRAFT_2080118 [Pisolithus croceorrhizus]KAI6156278.1 hypothetical protein EDD17DRAFT_1764433 [Pisolithus thermaeus]